MKRKHISKWIELIYSSQCLTVFEQVNFNRKPAFPCLPFRFVCDQFQTGLVNRTNVARRTLLVSLGTILYSKSNTKKYFLTFWKVNPKKMKILSELLICLYCLFLFPFAFGMYSAHNGETECGLKVNVSLLHVPCTHEPKLNVKIMS